VNLNQEIAMRLIGEQLKKVLMQEENVDRAAQMTKVQATQKNTF